VTHGERVTPTSMRENEEDSSRDVPVVWSVTFSSPNPSQRLNGPVDFSITVYTIFTDNSETDSDGERVKHLRTIYGVSAFFCKSLESQKEALGTPPVLVT
jgi:hypothetical protein